MSRSQRCRRQTDILLTLQERCSRLTLAERLQSKDATDTADAIIDKLAALPSTAVQTITYDNGGEFARHERVKDALTDGGAASRPIQASSLRFSVAGFPIDHFDLPVAGPCDFPVVGGDQEGGPLLAVHLGEQLHHLVG